MTGPLRTEPRRIVVGVTGASGAIYSVRLLQAIAQTEVEVHLAVSPSGAAVIKQELELTLDPLAVNLPQLLGYTPPWPISPGVRQMIAAASANVGNFRAHRYNDFLTPIASGSFLTDAMVICPCSGTTLSSISRAAAANLIQRAAEVHLKERRKLVLVPRETPLSTIQLENMHHLSLAGAVILPAMPGWYHGVDGIDSLVNFVVGRILDQVGVGNDIIHRWGQ
jgi:4-hydroxy-3-polyprenylbenzoate decarboxylase